MLNEEGNIVWSKTAVHPPWTWWPDLAPDVCKLAAGSPAWDLSNYDNLDKPPPEEQCVPHGIGSTLGCSGQFFRANLQAADFYVCPGQGHSREMKRRCGGASDYFCGKWGCETTGEAYWNPSSSWDLILVKKGRKPGESGEGERDPSKYPSYRTGCASGASGGPQGPCKGSYCNPLNISFTAQGKQDRQWVKGNRWGWRVYTGTGDPGFVFAIRIKIESPPARPVGPNPVLDDPLPRPGRLPSLTPSPKEGSSSGPNSYPLLTTSSHLPMRTEDRLFNLLDSAFVVLNRTNPTATQSCWLCFASNPPYYEGIAQLRSYNVTSDHSHCPWGNQRKLTLSAVSGTGLCIGKVPTRHQPLCNETIDTLTEGPNQYLVPPPDTWWACGTGLTPCLHTSLFNSTRDFCILVQLVPRVIYHDDNSFIDEFDHRTRYRREPVTLTLAVLLGLGVAAGIGTGATALIQQPHYYNELRAAMDADLGALEQSITKLEESLTSLSEVVLQNRRGLDLLFLKEGGLCAALREECCFYVDHSGVIRDSMAKLRERLENRKKEREAYQGWYENWFNRSPWFSTLVSTLAGPLIILLLILTFGPCILNRLVTFVKERISAVQVMVLRQQYQVLQEAEGSL